jgi:hypothetical protein
MAASLYRSYLVWLVSASFHTGLIRHRIAHTLHLFVARNTFNFRIRYAPSASLQFKLKTVTVRTPYTLSMPGDGPLATGDEPSSP